MNALDSKSTLYKQYPVSSVFLYNAATIAHYAVGCLGIYMGYGYSGIAAASAILYFGLAMIQMYGLMPFMVCPNCIYHGMEGALCISGMNVISTKFVPKGDVKKFSDRGKGIFCHNNYYIAALVVPILSMVPALFVNFSFILLSIFVSIVLLMLFRIFYIFPKVACVHCKAKHACPNAQSMGLS